MLARLKAVIDRVTGREFARVVARHRAAADGLDAAVREVLGK